MARKITKIPTSNFKISHLAMPENFLRQFFRQLTSKTFALALSMTSGGWNKSVTGFGTMTSYSQLANCKSLILFYQIKIFFRQLTLTNDNNNNFDTKLFKIEIETKNNCGRPFSTTCIMNDQTRREKTKMKKIMMSGRDVKT